MVTAARGCTVIGGTASRHCPDSASLLVQLAGMQIIMHDAECTLIRPQHLASDTEFLMPIQLKRINAIHASIMQLSVKGACISTAAALADTLSQLLALSSKHAAFSPPIKA